MPTALLERIRTAALNYPVLSGSPAVTTYPLRTLLGSGSPLIFRWYNAQLIEGSPLPAVTVFSVSNPPTYVFTQRTQTTFSRVQFVIWGGQGAAGVAAAQAVTYVLYPFFDTLNLVGIPGLAMYNNTIIGDREAVFPQTDPLIYQRVLDVRIFSNETL